MKTTKQKPACHWPRTLGFPLLLFLSVMASCEWSISGANSNERGYQWTLWGHKQTNLSEVLVSFQSTPPGASVMIGGSNYGVTPLSIPLPQVVITESEYILKSRPGAPPVETPTGQKRESPDSMLVRTNFSASFRYKEVEGTVRFTLPRTEAVSFDFSGMRQKKEVHIGLKFNATNVWLNVLSPETLKTSHPTNYLAFVVGGCEQDLSGKWWWNAQPRS